MEISATVPGRGNFMQYARPTFWENSKINNLREFYGDGAVAQESKGYSPFRMGMQDEPTKPWLGLREGNSWTPGSSVMSATVRPLTSALTDRSYPMTAATSARSRKGQPPPLHVIKHVNVDANTITEERIAMQTLQTENEELRRMCGELQRVVLFLLNR